MRGAAGVGGMGLGEQPIHPHVIARQFGPDRDTASREGAPWVSLLDDETKIVSSRLGADRFRVAGTAEFNGHNRDIRDVRVNPLTAWTRQLFPSMSTERVIPWTGLRPMTPSMLPRVGAGRAPGVFYNTGHGHLGWTLSAATASMVTDIVEASLRKPAHIRARSLAWKTGG
jgi:D-amino-acid dehydrogenase